HAIQRNDGFFPVEHAQHDVLTVYRGMAGHAKIDRTAAQVDVETAILRRARFGDVHAADDLEPHGNARPVGFMQAADLLQHAVDTVANAQECVFRFEVDV